MSMRSLSIALCAFAVATYAAPAVALNPQPLPPGFHTNEPPDPCVSVRDRRAHARCVARYQWLNPGSAVCATGKLCGNTCVAANTVCLSPDSKKNGHPKGS